MTPNSPDLAAENEALRAQLAALEAQTAQTAALWPLLVETTRRLQVSSAAVKASVSSLLNYDIFWDGANQHEFLETIDSSIDKAGSLVTLLALAFRLQAGTLALKLEPHMLQEVVFVLQAEMQERLSGLALRVSLPKEGRLVQIDYQYLLLTLHFLLEVLHQMGMGGVQLGAVEEEGRWRLSLAGLDAAAAELLAGLGATPPPEGVSLAAEYWLRLHVSRQLLACQRIATEMRAGQFCLLIPTVS
jgi:K+-sensing histidine kinase KdpD